MFCFISTSKKNDREELHITTWKDTIFLLAGAALDSGRKPMTFWEDKFIDTKMFFPHIRSSFQSFCGLFWETCVFLHMIMAFQYNKGKLACQLCDLWPFHPVLSPFTFSPTLLLLEFDWKYLNKSLCGLCMKITQSSWLPVDIPHWSLAACQNNCDNWIVCFVQSFI